MNGFLYLAILIATVCLLGGCHKKSVPAASVVPAVLKAEIRQTVFYETMPSASGIEKAGTGYYIIGDDAPYLYLLDADYKFAGKFALMDTSTFASGRIHTSTKPDLESITSFISNDTTCLLMLGSGSSKTRNSAFIVNAANPEQAKKVDLTKLYTFLHDILARNGVKQLNLEGLAMDEKHVYLLQRTFGEQPSILFRFKRNEFLNYLMDSDTLPIASVFHFRLPKLGPYQASFSGAYILQDKLFFTSTIEGTTDATVDGDVLGSFVGYIPLLELQEDKGFPVPVPVVQLKSADGKVYNGKAESLVVSQTDSVGTYKLVVVSDDDKGGSELLEVVLTGVQ